MKKAIRFFALVLSFVLLAGAASACGKNKKTGAMGNIQLPDWWMNWMPVTTDANIVNSWADDESGEKVLQFTTKQKFDQVFNNYKNAFKKESDFADAKNENGGSMIFGKENYFVNITFLPGPKECIIQITMKGEKSSGDVSANTTDSTAGKSGEASVSSDKGGTGSDSGSGSTSSGKTDAQGSLGDLGDLGNPGNLGNLGGLGNLGNLGDLGNLIGSGDLSGLFGSDSPLGSLPGFSENASGESSGSSEESGGNSEGSSGSSGGSVNASGGSPDGSGSIIPYSSLPQGYPRELVDIIPESTVAAGMREEDDGLMSYTVILSVNKSSAQAIEYYNKQLASIENKETQGNEQMYFIHGFKDNHEITISIVGIDSNSCNVNIQLRELPTIQDEFDRIETYEIPSGYPIDLLPVMPGAKVIDAYESESDGKKNYEIRFVSMESIKDVYKYIDTTLDGAEDKYKSSTSDYFSLDCSKGGYYFNISGQISKFGEYDFTDVFVYVSKK